MCPTMGFEQEEVLHQKRKEQQNPRGTVGILGAWCPQSPGCGGGQVQLSLSSKHPSEQQPHSNFH